MHLLQMYARKLGDCLLRLNDFQDCTAATADMQRWVTELTSLGACISYGNPNLLKAIQSASLDSKPAHVHNLHDTVYSRVLVSTT